MLRSHGIALWDVIASCEILGSADSSIKNVKANDLKIILSSAKIEKIFLNGKTAEKYFERLLSHTTKIKAICLPSTSPANAAFSIDDLVDAWRIILEGEG